MPLFVLLGIFLFGLVSPICNATTIPPVTTATLSGTAGQNGWYRSTINVTITSTDDQSGIAQLVYWIDSNPPTILNYNNQSANQFSNYSYEIKKSGNLENWYAGQSGLVVYYQSSVSSYHLNKSAAIAFGNIDPNIFFHWHNEPHSINLTTGSSIAIAAWTRTIVLPGDKSYFEVWGQDAFGNNDRLLVKSSEVVGFHWNWEQAIANLTIPSDVNYIYVKVGSNATPAAIVYWDYIQNSVTGLLSQSTSFNHTTEGVNVLRYYGKDFNQNIETTKSTNLKIDTIVPNPWQNFVATRASCQHCYDTVVENRDVTSGVDVSSAEYRFYTEHLEQYWSNWFPVTSVQLATNNQPVSDGETAFVKLITPEITFGDSAHPPFRMQYRITDMAGNTSTSPAYDITSPWVVLDNGSMYIDGDVVLPISPIGIANINADAAAFGSITSLTSSTNWISQNYSHDSHRLSQMAEFIDEYEKIKANANILTGELPSVNGIYRVESSYTLNSTTLKSTYLDANISAIFIIQGDLYIEQSFDIVDGNCSVFLVEGDILVNKQVEEIHGFFMAEGNFDSDTSGDSRKSLVVYGTMIALEGYILPRDLQDTGNENNTNTPAEKFIWQPKYLLNQTIAQYLENVEIKYQWNEIEHP